MEYEDKYMQNLKPILKKFKQLAQSSDIHPLGPTNLDHQ